MKRVYLVGVVLLLLFSGCEKKEKVSTKEQNISTPTKITPSATVLQLQDSNQTTITFTIKNDTIQTSLSNDIVLLFFFTSWCPSCKAQIPELKALKQIFPDIGIVGIPLDTIEDIQSFKQQYGIDFFVSTSYKTDTMLAKKVYRYIKAPATNPVPVIIILHKNSYFRHYIGAVPLAILQSDIQSLKEE